jgi:hypothetical protein
MRVKQTTTSSKRKRLTLKDIVVPTCWQQDIQMTPAAPYLCRSPSLLIQNLICKGLRYPLQSGDTHKIQLSQAVGQYA